jgi:hypothetical protein
MVERKVALPFCWLERKSTAQFAISCIEQLERRFFYHRLLFSTNFFSLTFENLKTTNAILFRKHLFVLGQMLR